jgi:hypothetical protein
MLRGLIAAPIFVAARKAVALERPGNLDMAILGHSYRTLASYADTGTVETVYQWPDTPEVAERHSFTTAFRAPRNFFFRFVGDATSGGDVFVIWCDGGDFQSWWKATNVHEVYDGGRGTLAFSLSASPTKEASNIVAPLLFPEAEMKGVASHLTGIEDRGEETIDGHVCRKLHASERETGMGVEKRPIGVWVDKDSGLIRRIVTEAEEGSASGLIDRVTFTLDPVADPELSDDRFVFTPPG